MLSFLSSASTLGGRATPSPFCFLVFLFVFFFFYISSHRIYSYIYIYIVCEVKICTPRLKTFSALPLLCSHVQCMYNVYICVNFRAWKGGACYPNDTLNWIEWSWRAGGINAVSSYRLPFGGVVVDVVDVTHPISTRRPTTSWAPAIGIQCQGMSLFPLCLDRNIVAVAMAMV